MPIRYQVGDATSPQCHGPCIIVHVCNDIGRWGRGFVLALSRRWAEPEKQYRDWKRGKATIPFQLGQVQFVQVSPDTWVANLIGQSNLFPCPGMPPIRYDAVRDGLRRVALEALRLGASVHMPRIGCGLAGGRWAEIETIVNEELIAAGIEVTVYDLPSAGC
jgi:O-acetyl-ADP-ribose deacetylase (regulator of RNase III)